MTRLATFTAAGIAALLLAATTALAAYQFETAWGSAGTGAGQFNQPSFLAVGPDGSVYVTDSGNNRVEKFTADGAFQLTFGSAGAGTGQFNTPVGVGVGPDGSVYVVDQVGSRVEHFDANGNFLSQWGTPGSGDGQFSSPDGLAVGPDGSVYVADSGNNRVEKFLADGTFVQSFTSGAGPAFSSVRGVAAGPDGSVYVVDGGNSRIERFDSNGVFQNAWGSAGSADGQFNQPNDVAASAAGVYVTDPGNNRVEKFTSTGAFVDSLDQAGSGDPSFDTPFNIAISSTGLIYLDQTRSSRIARYSETGSSNLPPPQTGVSANAQPVNGTVRVKQPGSSNFVLLPAGAQIPIGSIVDVTKGTVDLTTTASNSATQTARFYEGIFKLTQTKSSNPVTELQLFGGNFKKICGTAGGARVASASRKVKKTAVRHLWGVGKGTFRTKGRYASATIRGTQWLTEDRCDATVVRVTQGSVTVRDLVKNKNVTVAAPKSYVAGPKH